MGLGSGGAAVIIINGMVEANLIEKVTSEKRSSGRSVGESAV